MVPLHLHLVLPPHPLTSLPLVLCKLTIPLPPGLGVTSLPGLIFWFVSLSMRLTSPPGLPLSMCLTPSLLFPRPRLVPFPAPHFVPRPRHFPRTGIPSSPCILLPVRRHLPPRLVSWLGAVWSKPSAARTHLPRHAPHDSFPSDTPTPPLSFRPLPCDLPIPSVLVPAPSSPHSCPSPATSLGLLSTHHHADSPTILPHPCNHHDKHPTSCPGRSRSPTTPLRPKDELPRLRVISQTALSLEAGLVHNWSLHYAPYLGATFSFNACLDRDSIDRLWYCGVTTVWQSIFGALVACISRARVLAILPNYCSLSRIILCTAIHRPHSRRSSLSLRPLQDLISQARLEAFFQVLRFLSLASFRFVSVFGLARFLLRFGASWGLSGSPFCGLRFPSKARLFGNLVKHLLCHLFLGDGAVSGTSRFSGRITARSKKPPFSPRFQGTFLFGSDVYFSLEDVFPVPLGP